MRVIIDVPEKFLVMAASLISAAVDDNEDVVDIVVKKCQDKDVEVDFKDLELSKSEVFQMNIAMATLAITKALDEIREDVKKGGGENNGD